MTDLKHLEVWFVTGSQRLYGGEPLKKIAEHSKEIVLGLAREKIPVNIVFKSVLTSADAITDLCLDANSAKNCMGLIAWMHTFSAARMWIAGLKAFLPRLEISHLPDLLMS